MKTKTNKGFSKVSLLTLSAIVLAAGFGIYSCVSNDKEIDTSKLSPKAKSTIADVDMNSLESIATALYSSILIDNYSSVAPLVSRYQKLEYALHQDEYSHTTFDDFTKKPVNISEYLTGAAINKLEEKIRYLHEKLLSKQTKSSYKFYLESLIKILSFYQSESPDIKDLADSLDAYQSFMNNQDYTINDIKVLYGNVESIKVCRYLMGSGDYSRMSPFEMKEYISKEIVTLFDQIPEYKYDKKPVYGSTDFAQLTVPALKDLIVLNYELPVIINTVAEIDGIKQDETKRKYDTIKNKFSKKLDKSIDYLKIASDYYQCQATTYEDFKVTAKPISKFYQGVGQTSKLSLDAVKVRLNTKLSGCHNKTDVYVLMPNIAQYEKLFLRSSNKLSDEELQTYKKDIALLKSFNEGKEIDFSIQLSDVAAVEDKFERFPEQGYFVGKKEYGLLYNIILDSYAYLETLDILPKAEQIFVKNNKSKIKRNQARYKLAIIDDFSKVISRMKALDFNQLESTPYKYLTERNFSDLSIQYNYSNEQLMSSINGNSFALRSDILNDSETAEYSIEIASTDINNISLNTSNSADATTIATNTTAENSQTIVANNTLNTTNSNNLAENSNLSVNNTNSQTTTSSASNLAAQDQNIASTTVSDTTTTTTSNVADSTIKQINDEVTLDNQNKQNAKDAIKETQDKNKVVFLTSLELKNANNKDVIKQHEDGNLDATYELAIRKIRGSNKMHKNFNEGRDLLAKATDAKHYPSMSLLGSIYYKSNSKEDIKKLGAQYILEAAANNMIDSYYDAAKIYSDGKYTTKDNEKAFELLSVLADQGNSKAQYDVALMYLNGSSDVEKSSYKAINLLSAAAKRNPQAAYTLAQIYDGSIKTDVQSDINKANEYYVVSARQNYAKAYKLAANTLMKDDSTQREAEKYLLSLQKNNQLDNEGRELLFNYYVSKNNSDGIASLIVTSSADVQKDYPVEMGLIYEKGLGVTQNYKKAIEFYRTAIAQNKPKAFCQLGRLFLHGKGTKQDLRAAVGHFSRGSDAGQEQCTRDLAYIKITHPNYENFYEGYDLLKKLSANNQLTRVDKTLLGAMYLYGTGTKVNEQLGYKLLNQANTVEANLLVALHSKKPEKLQKLSCKYPILSGAYGVTMNNNSYIANATFNDLFFMRDLKEYGASTIYDDIHLSSMKVCRSSYIGILHDSNTKFKQPSIMNPTDPKEIYELAMINFNGQGVVKNFIKAFSLMQKASELGYTKAHNNLGVFYLLGIGTSQNGKLAFEAFTRAAAVGDPKATFNAAAVRKIGIGVKPDHSKALDQLVASSSKGYTPATIHLVYSYDYGNGFEKNYNLAYKYFARYVINNETKNKNK